MKNLQWGADRTRKKYPAYEKFHKKLSVHCSKGVGSTQTRNSQWQGRTNTNDKPKDSNTTFKLLYGNMKNKATGHRLEADKKSWLQVVVYPN